MQRSVLRAAALFGALLAAAPGPVGASDPPAVVAIALDTSGSVGPRDLDRARTLVLSILGALPAGSEVAVFTFDDQARVVVPRTADVGLVRRRLATVRIRGRYTALNDVVYDASRYLRDAPATRRAIVLVTDGRDENSAVELGDGLRVAQDAGIPVYAIGVGRIQERTLRRVAKLTGGEYVAFARARGSAIASRITSLPAAGAPAAASPATAQKAPSTTPVVPPVTAGRPEGQAPAPSPEGSGRLFLIWSAVGLAVLSAAALVLARARRSRPAACPTCGRELPSPLTECPDCADAEAAPLRRPADEGLSPTMLAKMNVTEEYLEKTVQLRACPVLSVVKGAEAGKSFELSLDSATSIGRARVNDFQVSDVSVSTQHCRIRPEDGRFVLHDLKSTNGTFVNDKRVARHVLAEGDVIKVGETQIVYKTDMARG